jgi:hypothetical protein
MLTVIPFTGTISQIVTVTEKGINTLYLEGVDYQFKIAIKLLKRGFF